MAEDAYATIVLNPILHGNPVAYAYTTGFSAAELTLLQKHPDACLTVLRSAVRSDSGTAGRARQSLRATPSRRLPGSQWADTGGTFSSTGAMLLAAHVRIPMLLAVILLGTLPHGRSCFLASRGALHPGCAAGHTGRRGCS